MSLNALHSTVACVLLVSLLTLSGCSRVVVTAADRELTAEYLKDASIQALFPEKIKSLELAMIDQQAGLPEFNFEWNGYRGVYQKGGQQLEVLVLNKLDQAAFRSLHEAVRESAIENGDNADRLRFNNASYTFWSADGRVYRFYPLQGDLIVFRTTRNVSELPLVKEYLRQRMSERDGVMNPIAVAR